MSKFGNYLLLKTIPQKQSTMEFGGGYHATGPEAAAINGSRIAYSLAGLLLGIFLSFVIVGIDSTGGGSGGPKSPPALAGMVDSTKTSSIQQPTSRTEATSSPDVKPIHWNDLWKFGLITLVICGLTYQGLYLSLKLYVNEPAFLTIFIAFQYGFFWQAVIHGGSAFLAHSLNS